MRGVVESVAVQADGKIVAAGYVFNGTWFDAAVARYNANGTLDTSFSGDGMLTATLSSRDDMVTGIALQSDGKIIAAGVYDNAGNNDFFVVRCRANTSPAVSAAVGSTANEDAPPYTLSLLQNATDPDGNTLSVSGLSLTSGDARGVTVSGHTLSIIPGAYTHVAAGTQQVVRYNYRVSDGQEFVNQTATVTITGSNDAPIAANQSAAVAEDTPTAVTLSAADVDTTSLGYMVRVGPAHGVLTGTGANRTYTPHPAL